MASKSIKIKTVTAVLLIFVTGEAAAYWLSRNLSVDPLMLTGITRLTQILACIWIILRQEQHLSAIGWSPDTWSNGLFKGAGWSLGFGVVAGLAMMLAFWLGLNPLVYFKGSLDRYHLPLFFIVGGLIAPVFEEICFRGVIYNYMRRIGIRMGAFFTQSAGLGNPSHPLVTLCAVIFAIIGSTAVFAILHCTSGLPFTQIVGGIVFALAYETSGNLMVPITIHVTGNLAIFSLSLLAA